MLQTGPFGLWLCCLELRCWWLLLLLCLLCRWLCLLRCGRCCCCWSLDHTKLQPLLQSRSAVWCRQLLTQQRRPQQVLLLLHSTLYSSQIRVLLLLLLLRRRQRQRLQVLPCRMQLCVLLSKVAAGRLSDCASQW